MFEYEIFDDPLEQTIESRAASSLADAIQSLAEENRYDEESSSFTISKLPTNISKEFYGCDGLYSWMLRFMFLTEFPESSSTSPVTVLAGRISQILLQQVQEAIRLATKHKACKALRGTEGFRKLKILSETPIEDRPDTGDCITELKVFLRYSAEMQDTLFVYSLDVRRYNCTVGLLNLFVDKVKERTQAVIESREVPKEFSSLRDCANAVAIATRVAKLIRTDRLIALLK